MNRLMVSGKISHAQCSLVYLNEASTFPRMMLVARSEFGDFSLRVKSILNIHPAVQDSSFFSFFPIDRMISKSRKCLKRARQFLSGLSVKHEICT